MYLMTPARRAALDRLHAAQRERTARDRARRAASRRTCGDPIGRQDYRETAAMVADACGIRA